MSRLQVRRRAEWSVREMRRDALRLCSPRDGSRASTSNELRTSRQAGTRSRKRVGRRPGGQGARRKEGKVEERDRSARGARKRQLAPRSNSRYDRPDAQRN